MGEPVLGEPPSQRSPVPFVVVHSKKHYLELCTETQYPSRSTIQSRSRSSLSQTVESGLVCNTGDFF